jgi:hypothetical protein
VIDGVDLFLGACLWVVLMACAVRAHHVFRIRRIRKALRSNVSTRCPVFSDPRKPTQPSH